ncbi:hypothetical protein EON65_11595 [archaeon]|nr:MAG: hypothetical protein EON65_11595 [archaeon]
MSQPLDVYSYSSVLPAGRFHIQFELVSVLLRAVTATPAAAAAVENDSRELAKGLSGSFSTVTCAY